MLQKSRTLLTGVKFFKKPYFLIFMTLICSQFTAMAQLANNSSRFIPFKGQLTDSNGSPVNLKDVQIYFTLSNASNTCYLYKEKIKAGDEQGNIFHNFGSSVDIVSGTYSASLFTIKEVSGTSSSDDISSCSVSESDQRFISVSIEGFNDLTLKVPLHTVPFAMNAMTLNGKRSADLVSNDDNVIKILRSRTASDYDKYLHLNSSGELTWSSVGTSSGTGNVTSQTIINALSYTPAGGSQAGVLDNISTIIPISNAGLSPLLTVASPLTVSGAMSVSGSITTTDSITVSGHVIYKPQIAPTRTCINTEKGSQRYNSDTNAMEYCNGSRWRGIGGITSCEQPGYTLVGTPGTASAFCISSTTTSGASFTAAREACIGSVDGYQKTMCSLQQYDFACNDRKLDNSNDIYYWLPVAQSLSQNTNDDYGLTIEYDITATCNPKNIKFYKEQLNLTNRSYRCCYQ